jgi:hypothetical protein
LDIKDLKELKALIQMCRKQGVTEFGLGNFACKLGPLPIRSKTSDNEDEQSEESYEEEQIDKLVGMPINPTDEQLMDMYHPVVNTDEKVE